MRPLREANHLAVPGAWGRVASGARTDHPLAFPASSPTSTLPAAYIHAAPRRSNLTFPARPLP